MRRTVAGGAIVFLVMSLTGCLDEPKRCGGHAMETQPCPPTTPSVPAVPPVPELPPGRHPVVAHDCGDGGSGVRERRIPPPEGGRAIDAHVIEVYQTRNDHSFGHHPEGAADVYVHATVRPQLLILKAYEPTKWRIHADDAVRIPLVVVDGYHRQEVEGVSGDVEVVTSGNWSSIPDRGLAALAEQPPASETYCYDASLFSIRPYLDQIGS